MNQRFFLLLAGAWWFWITASAAETNPELNLDAHVEFRQANLLFDRANEKAMQNPAEAQQLYRDAILHYRLLLDEQGWGSPELHANLGNACFMAGDHGRAVLHYQRSLSLDPHQTDVRHNLDYARSLTIDALPPSKLARLVHVLFFWHRWPADWRFGMLAVAHSLFWFVAAACLYRRSRKRLMALASCGFVTLLLLLSLLATHRAWDNPVDGVVLDRELMARQGDGFIYDQAFTTPLHAGTEFSLLEQKNNWMHVRLLDGSRCWLPADGVGLIQQGVQSSGP